MFCRFYPDSPVAASELFASLVLESGKRPVSAAMVQGYFMFYKNDPEMALTNVDKLWELWSISYVCVG